MATSLPDFLPPDIEGLFKKLTRSDYKVTSREDDTYNCVSWALDKAFTDRWIDPTGAKGTTWPTNVPKGLTVATVVALYQTLGKFSKCASDTYEDGVEKIAIYGDASDKFLHVARQLGPYGWTSKLGPCEDISHVSLNVLNGDEYGEPKVIMARPLASSAH